MDSHSSCEAFRGFIGITFCGLTAQGISSGKTAKQNGKKRGGGKMGKIWWQHGKTVNQSQPVWNKFTRKFNCNFLYFRFSVTWVKDMHNNFALLFQKLMKISSNFKAVIITLLINCFPNSYAIWFQQGKLKSKMYSFDVLLQEIATA